MSDPSRGAGSSADVRMQGFARRSTVEQAWQWIDEQLARRKATAERLPLERSAGRVLFASITSNVDVPLFARSMMDGYALRAEDTRGATQHNRLQLRVIGQALPGKPCLAHVVPQTAVRIMTGAPLPLGADAVLPVERCEVAGEHVYALESTAPGKHVGRRGEDIAAGAEVLPAARRLRPQDLGVLSSIGHGEVDVVRRPRVRVIATGNELLPAGSKPAGHQIVDANGPMLAALVERDGGDLCGSDLIADAPHDILAALQAEADIVLISGGSSVGQEDYAPLLVAQQGELAIHGIAIRPGSPAGMGRLGERLVFLLPGNPVSSLCAYDYFAGRAIRACAGLSPAWPYASRKLPLARQLASAAGRIDYVRVSVVDCQVEPVISAGASVLSSTTQASGFVIIPADTDRYPAGAVIEVFFYDFAEWQAHAP